MPDASWELTNNSQTSRGGRFPARVVRSTRVASTVLTCDSLNLKATCAIDFGNDVFGRIVDVDFILVPTYGWRRNTHNVAFKGKWTAFKGVHRF